MFCALFFKKCVRAVFFKFFSAFLADLASVSSVEAIFVRAPMSCEGTGFLLDTRAVRSFFAAQKTPHRSGVELNSRDSRGKFFRRFFCGFWRLFFHFCEKYLRLRNTWSFQEFFRAFFYKKAETVQILGVFLRFLAPNLHGLGYFCDFWVFSVFWPFSRFFGVFFFAIFGPNLAENRQKSRKSAGKIFVRAVFFAVFDSVWQIFRIFAIFGGFSKIPKGRRFLEAYLSGFFAGVRQKNLRFFARIGLRPSISSKFRAPIFSRSEKIALRWSTKIFSRSP